MRLPDINNHTVLHITAPTVDHQEAVAALETKIQDLKVIQEAILKVNHQKAKTKVVKPSSNNKKVANKPSSNNKKVANKPSNSNKTLAPRAQTLTQDLTQGKSRFSSLEIQTTILPEISALVSSIDNTRELPQ